MTQRACAFGRCDDDGHRTVGLQTAVEEPVGIHDPRRMPMVFNGHRCAHLGFGVEPGVAALRHGNVGEVIRRRTIARHVGRIVRAENCCRVRGAERHEPLAGPFGQAGAAGTARAAAVERAEDEDVLAQPRIDGHRGGGNERARRRSAVRIEHLKVARLQPERVVELVRIDRIGEVILVGHDAVDVVNGEPGVGDRVQACFGREVDHARPGRFRKRRPADAGDGRLIGD